MLNTDLASQMDFLRSNLEILDQANACIAAGKSTAETDKAHEEAFHAVARLGYCLFGFHTAIVVGTYLLSDERDQETLSKAWEAASHRPFESLIMLCAKTAIDLRY